MHTIQHKAWEEFTRHHPDVLEFCQRDKDTQLLCPFPQYDMLRICLGDAIITGENIVEPDEILAKCQAGVKKNKVEKISANSKANELYSQALVGDSKKNAKNTSPETEQKARIEV